MICRRPELWLLDEPHAGLDSAGRDTVDDLVNEAAERGATVLVVSHELDRAERIATRHVTIDAGVVQAGVVDAGVVQAGVATCQPDGAGPTDDS